MVTSLVTGVTGRYTGQSDLWSPHWSLVSPDVTLVSLVCGHLIGHWCHRTLHWSVWSVVTSLVTGVTGRYTGQSGLWSPHWALVSPDVTLVSLVCGHLIGHWCHRTLPWSRWSVVILVVNLCTDNTPAPRSNINFPGAGSVTSTISTQCFVGQPGF